MLPHRYFELNSYFSSIAPCLDYFYNFVEVLFHPGKEPSFMLLEDFKLIFGSYN